jgi:hypothetical protein
LARGFAVLLKALLAAEAGFAGGAEGLESGPGGVPLLGRAVREIGDMRVDPAERGFPRDEVHPEADGSAVVRFVGV